MAGAAGDATLGVAAGHARATLAALAGVESAVARGEGLVATLGRLARQTQRTALNASIEAARAGDEGRAFGAVAESMQRLADDAAAAARTTTAALAEAREAVERATRAGWAAAEGVEGARTATAHYFPTQNA